MSKIAIENVNHPGRTSNVDAAMYEAMRKAVLKALPARGPGLTVAELRAALVSHLPQDLYPGGAKAGWWVKAVQLDLEAKGVVRRTRTSPLRLHRVR
jgi:hypothetical protein